MLRCSLVRVDFLTVVRHIGHGFCVCLWGKYTILQFTQRTCPHLVLYMAKLLCIFVIHRIHSNTPSYKFLITVTTNTQRLKKKDLSVDLLI
ncbi:Ciliogenesis and planar polarity effector [Trichinella pseudospiralis]